MIFEDPTRRRWRWALVAAAVAGAAALTLLAVFAASVLTDPRLPKLAPAHRPHVVAATAAPAAGPNAQAPRAASGPLTPGPVAAAAPGAGSFASLPATATGAAAAVGPAPAALASATDATPSAAVGSARRAPGAFGRLPRKGPSYVTAFLVQEDPDSLASFEAHAEQIDVVFPDWYLMTSGDCTVGEQIEDGVGARLALDGVSVMPRVTNGDAAGWHADGVRKVLHDPALRSCVAQRLAALTVRDEAAGLNLDLETLEARDNVAYAEFVLELAQRLHAQGKLLTVDVTANDPSYDLESIGKNADAVVLMAYDEHYPSGAPGPIASQNWFIDALDAVLDRVPSKKVVVALGSYGYDWTRGSKRNAESLKFGEVMALAAENEAEPELHPEARNMQFEYEDEDGARHQVWFLNSVTAWNQEVLLRRHHLLGVSLWRLGGEDPTLWSFLGKPAPTADELGAPRALPSLEALSVGELFRIQAEPKPGTLEFGFDDDGTIDYALYKTVPTGYVIERAGREIADRRLVLTFDDGPDPTWTPRVLDVLKKYQVPATFFVVGDQARRFPDLVARMVREGHTLGNHSYLHPNFSSISEERARLEINSTQRLIEAQTGRKTLLFRAPFTTDSTPRSAAELAPLSEAARLGYVIVGANVDAQDWQRPGVDAIVARIEEQVAHRGNHVIVFHDAGGERSQTVEALEVLLPRLAAQGYRFARIDEAAGLSPQVLWPELPRGESRLVLATRVLSNAMRFGWFAIVVLFALTTGLAVGRVVFLGFFAVRSRRRARRTPPPPTTAAEESGEKLPFVSVVIPAYNEEKTLRRTVEAIRRTGYADREILVVNDGSTDRTEAVANALSLEDPRVRVLSKENGGKSNALNLGFREARAEIVVTLDADTLVAEGTLAALVRPLLDPRVDAVCGNVEVGNADHGLWTRFQALEYITSQNFDRQAFDDLNCINVVPGATGAWRKAKVLAVGGYSQDTLTEDADLTLSLLRAGGRIVYAPEARSRTEAPETVRALARQRFRWSYGTFQCLRKHASGFFKGTVGWVALPNILFFQLLFPVLSPLGDLVALAALLRGDMPTLLMGYGLFLFVDVGGALLAFHLEGRRKGLIALTLVQRFCYRQFMYGVTFRSILAILKGRRHGWNKLERSGSVTVDNGLRTT